MSAMAGRDTLVEYAIAPETALYSGLIWKVLGMMRSKALSEPWDTETAAREYISRIVQYGHIGQDIFHQINPSNIKSYCWMLDEMKWFSDQGLLIVDTVDKISKYVRDSR